MSNPGLTRTLFLALAAAAVGLLIGSTACTRRGGNGGPIPSTPTPITQFYVDPVRGNDVKNTGTTASSPFKTIKHALQQVVKVTPSPAAGFTISLAAGAYTTATGESFPIVLPTGISLVISGSNYGHTSAHGAFIDGYGEDKTLERALHLPALSTFATIEVPTGVTTTLNQVYVGTTAMLGTHTTYNTTDVLGTLSSSQTTYGLVVTRIVASGVIVPSGSFTCLACVIAGREYAIKTFELPGSSTAPMISLSGPGQALIIGGDGIRSDGTASVVASSQIFEVSNTAYTDAIAVPTISPAPSSSPSSSPSTSPSPTTYPSGYPTTSPYPGVGKIDFGTGVGGSPGDNHFEHAATEIYVTLPGAVVTARSDTWNPKTQHSNAFGLYGSTLIFRPGTSGKNVTISSKATGAKVEVGPALPPTPTPAPSPSGSPSPSPSPT